MTDNLWVSHMTQAIIYALIAVGCGVVALRYFMRWLHRIRKEPNAKKTAEKVSAILACVVLLSAILVQFKSNQEGVIFLGVIVASLVYLGSREALKRWLRRFE